MGGLKRDADTYIFKERELGTLNPKFAETPRPKNVIKNIDDLERLAFGKPKRSWKPKLG